ncbi:MAG: lysylphosphatidylglycerol synthase transmembrane domain-containing protein [Anaerolineales bacterium]
MVRSSRGWRLGVNVAPGILVGLLLYFALRGARLDIIWHLIVQLQARQLLAILGLDAAIFLVFGLRWWLVARVQAAGMGLADAVLVRLAAFGISYFTPGPQFGGEPLQAIYLNRRHGASIPNATAAVALDKLIELLGNYFFLVAGVAAAISSGLIPLASPVTILGVLLVAALAAWPLAHLLLLRAHAHPLSAALARALQDRGQRSRFVRSIRISERLMGRFCRRRPGRLMALLALSLCAGGLAVAEYALVISSFSAVLNVGQTLSAWTASWLSFLIPVPGGLGALEASQVAALGHFGVAAEAAIGVTLLIRARDIVMGGTGMLLAALRWQPWTSTRRQTGVC